MKKVDEVSKATVLHRQARGREGEQKKRCNLKCNHLTIVFFFSKCSPNITYLAFLEVWSSDASAVNSNQIRIRCRFRFAVFLYHSRKQTQCQITRFAVAMAARWKPFPVSSAAPAPAPAPTPTPTRGIMQGLRTSLRNAAD